MANEIPQMILNAHAGEMEPILAAVRARYAQLYPDWEITVISIEKQRDRKSQVDHIIKLLENMKENP